MAFSGLGSGVLGDPYQITTWAQFKEIAANLTSHFKLMNDIAASGAYGASSFFTGVLDGDNKSITAIPDNGSNPVLFGLNGGTVKNISLTIVNTVDSIFGNITGATPTESATFDNITISSSSVSTGLTFCANMSNCNLSNITIYHTGSAMLVNLATVINNCTFTNVLIHAFHAINIGYTVGALTGVLVNSTFTDCKFISRPASRSISTSDIYSVRSNTVNATTFAGCLFYGANPWINIAQVTIAENIPTYTRCSFIADWYGNYSSNANASIMTLSLVGNYNKCYFGGKLEIIIASWMNLGTNKFFTATDCHFDIKYIITGGTSYPMPIFHRSGTQTSVLSRIFCESEIVGASQTANTVLVDNGTNCFINSEKVNCTKLVANNYTQLTTAQTQNSANFTNFDFDTVWQIANEEAPKLRNVIYDPTPYFIVNPITSVTLSNVDLLSVNAYLIFKCVLNPIDWTCYFSADPNNIEILENAGTKTAVNIISYNSTKEAIEGLTHCVLRYNDRTATYSISSAIYHFTIADIPITTIDITTGNFITMLAPSVNYVHGTVVVGDYLYGATREVDGANFFKLKCNDYADVTYLMISATGLGNLLRFEQIVYCSGFLWMQSNNIAGTPYDLLVRVNPVTLEYVVFKISENNADNALSEPIGTDGTFLYASCYTSVRKITPPLSTLAEYGYIQGDAPIALPVNSIIGTCNLLLPHPTAVARVHSIIIDSNHIYLACTATAAPNGIFDNIQITHLQKINKLTMLTDGDIPCPKTTDDMTQNENYIFLAPELISSAVVALGDEMGLIAIKKSNLAFKYLKALTSSDYGATQTLRSCFGVQYFGDYMMVQKNNQNESYIIDTSDIDNWGEDFPVGGATLARLRFTLNGAAFLTPPANELSLGSDGKFHANTWTNVHTTVFKFNVDGFVFSYPPVVQTVLIQSLINSTTIGGTILSPGSSDVTMVGLRYGTVSTNLDQIISFENPSINFQSVLNLTPGIYYFQAYAANSVGTSYGSIVPFVVGNTVILSHDSAGAAASLRNNNCGHAVRFCKPAWGVADGTIGSVTDKNGKVYKTVVINEIEWAAEDLTVELYNNEDEIPEVKDNAAWGAAEDGARAGYNNISPND